MSIATTTYSQSYACNGATTSFNVTFTLLDNTHLKVYLIETATGTETLLTSGVNYTLVGGNPATSITTTTTYSADYSLRLERVTPKTQSQNFDVGQTYITERVEGAVDKLTLIVQELYGEDEVLNARIDDLLTDILAAQTAAEAAQAAAEAAQAAAETAQTNAQTAETNAETAEANAEAAQTAAETARDQAVYDVQGSVASPELVDGAAQVALTGVTRRHFLIIEGDGGAVDQSVVNPQIDPPLNDGDELTLVANSNTNTVKFASGNGLLMNGDYIMQQNSMISFIGVNSVWVEKSRNNI